MAVWDSASIQANSAIHRERDRTRAEAPDVEPEIANKWHPAATLAFIVLSCGLLWAGIFAAFRLLF
jgi:hypothetical protein